MIAKNKNRLVKFYIIAVIILLIFLSFFKIFKPLQNVSLGFLTGAQSTTYSFFSRLKYAFVNYQDAQSIKKEKFDLINERNQLLIANSQLENYKVENEKLRALLGFYQTVDYEYVTAKVIGKDIIANNTLIINKGTVDGVHEGFPVIVDNGVIIGKIVKARDNLSTLLILTDNLSQLAISTLTSNKTTGLAKGEFGLSLKVELIPQDVEIKTDDLIITSGLETNIPRGLLIGKVNRIISHENDLFKSVTITPLVDYNEITVLSVIIPKQYDL